MPRPLLVALDRSPQADDVCAHAKRLAEQLDAPVVVVHALRLPAGLSQRQEVVHPGSGQTMTAEAMLRADAQRDFEERCATLSDGPTEARLELRIGEPLDVIAAVAKEIEPQQIVLGASASVGLRAFFSNALSGQLSRRVDCAVVAVPPSGATTQIALSTGEMQALAELDG